MDAFGYKEDGYFVEVGAFDCYTWSNTYGLAAAGWRGVYFEPVARHYYKCLERYKENDRITVINKAISSYAGECEIILGGSLSTISREQRDKYLSMDWSRSTGLAANTTQVVKISTLDKELDALGTPTHFDVLVIDVEGSELDALKGFTINKWLPTLAIIETHEGLENELSADEPEISAMFSACGYTKIYVDHINTIYKKSKRP